MMTGKSLGKNFQGLPNVWQPSTTKHKSTNRTNGRSPAQTRLAGRSIRDQLVLQANRSSTPWKTWKGKALSDSLSALLPLPTSPCSLAWEANVLLETLSDMTSDFEIVLIPHRTADVAMLDAAEELAVQYPQIRVERCHGMEERDMAVRQAMEQAGGSMVFVHDPQAACSPARLRNAWEATRRLPAAGGSARFDQAEPQAATARHRAGSAVPCFVRKCPPHEARLGSIPQLV